MRSNDIIERDRTESDVTAIPGSAAAAVEHLITLGVLSTGAALAAWYLATALTLLTCTAARGLGRRWPSGEAAVRAWGAPALRRGATAAAGLALGAGLGVAGAAQPALPDDLGWRSTTSGAGSEEYRTTPAPQVTRPVAVEIATRRTAPSSTPPRDPLVVRPGDSLWTIAAADLEARDLPADAANVAREWPRWYAANRAVVGPDPHLIHPGQHLQPPREGVHR